ncbi:MAG: hypothetical protein E4H14_02590 [Candidatus Thorarchaeota archaeon]|nr:MAG: hypothetical protein E4H14_02590 [Candidatus Thorarchaeota archaeon]
MIASKSRKTAIAASAIVIVILGSSFLYVSMTPTGPLVGVSVAVYDDRGTTATSQTALEAMFRWMGASVTVIGGDDVANGALDNYDIFVAPGGCWCDERCEILDDYDIIREFILNGGSFFGVDSGASYAVSYRLGLFDGVYNSDCNGTGDKLITMNVNHGSTGPDLSGELESYNMFYESSGYFYSDNMTGIIPICTYTDTGYFGMIAFEYGNGTVFLSGPHPEYEEGSMRDNTDFWDTDPDPDSEWNFMLKVTQWLLAESM